MLLRGGLIVAIVAAASLAACGKKEAPAAPADSWGEVSAPLIGEDGKPAGSVALRSAPGGVLMRIEASGLKPGWHGLHFHQVGDCSDFAGGFKNAAAHFNPDGLAHGLAHAGGAERGDLPNIHAGADGAASAEIFRAGVALNASEESAAALGPFPLLDDDGFAVIIHAAPDDHETQPIGGAGERVACAALTPQLPPG
jgi:Cu-Zn family superoxide dismutase